MYALGKKVHGRVTTLTPVCWHFPLDCRGPFHLIYTTKVRVFWMGRCVFWMRGRRTSKPPVDNVYLLNLCSIHHRQLFCQGCSVGRLAAATIRGCVCAEWNTISGPGQRIFEPGLSGISSGHESDACGNPTREMSARPISLQPVRHPDYRPPPLRWFMSFQSVPHVLVYI